MTKDIPYNKPSFLHWEGHPTNSRAVLTAGEAFKTGELLVFTDKGYEPYKGTGQTPPRHRRASSSLSPWKMRQRAARLSVLSVLPR